MRVSQHSSSPGRAFPVWHVLARPLLRGFGSPVWSPLGPVHFQLCCGHGGMDPQGQVWGAVSSTLSRRFPDSRPSDLLRVCLERRSGPGRVFPPGLAASPVQMRRSLARVNVSGDRAQFDVSDGLVTAGQACGNPCAPQRWSAKSWCSRMELESLIGSLHHVTKVVPPGRSFLRRMIDLLCAFRSPSHPIRLNTDFRRDLGWWLDFLQTWNAVSFFRMPSVSSLPEFFVASDSSGAHGFGAIWRNEWFAGYWPPSVPTTNITTLELFPIVVAAHVWGSRWQRWQVEFLCDNDAMVAIINSGSSRDKCCMHLLRRLVLVACQFHFSVSARHVPGRHNSAADSLSRSCFQEFRRLHPSADPSPTFLPPELVTELLPLT